MMFKVLENGTPAAYPHLDVDPSWANCEFDTLEQAQAYVRKWLGCFVGPDFEISVDEPYCYNGQDHIEVVVVEDDYKAVDKFFDDLSKITDPAEIKDYLSVNLDYAWACLRSLK